MKFENRILRGGSLGAFLGEVTKSYEYSELLFGYLDYYILCFSVDFLIFFSNLSVVVSIYRSYEMLFETYFMNLRNELLRFI